MNEVRDAALEYVALGWSVLPLRQRSKFPATETSSDGTSGVNAACNDAAMVDEYFSDVENWNDKANIGIAMGVASGNLICIDIDVGHEGGADGFDFLHDWEREHGELPDTVMQKTPKGGAHYLYRVNNSRLIGNSSNPELGIDIKSDGGYIVAYPSIHPDTGTRYEWEQHPADYDVADADENVLAFVERVQEGCFVTGNHLSNTGKFTLPEVVEKGDRDITMFRLASSFIGRGYKDDEVLDACTLMNRSRFKPPMRDSDVSKCVHSALKMEAEKKAKQAEEEAKRNAEQEQKQEQETEGSEESEWSFYGPRGKFLHNVVGDYLIKEHSACYVDGQPVMWDGEQYRAGYESIRKEIIDAAPSSTRSNQNEVINYVLHRAPEREAADPNIIAFSNCTYNNLTGEQGKLTRGDIIFNVVPHAYNENAYCEDADKFLDTVSCGDFAIRANLEEVIGLCLYRRNDYGISIILTGSGSNGKSTFLKVLSYILGQENVSNLDLFTLGERFQASQIIGKLANIGDDISNSFIDGKSMSVFKKMVTGERIYCDVKGAEGIHFVPTCTFIFSANEFPRLEDYSDGSMRRLFGIPFNASFHAGDANYDPHILKKLQTEEAAEYFIQLGLLGLIRISANGCLTQTTYAKDIRESIKLDNDSVAQWVDYCGYKASDLVNQSIAHAYQNYVSWANDSNIKPVSRRTFTSRVNKEFCFISQGGRERTFRPKKIE